VGERWKERRKSIQKRGPPGKKKIAGVSDFSKSASAILLKRRTKEKAGKSLNVDVKGEIYGKRHQGVPWARSWA